jgi:ribosomal protein L13E
MLMTKVKLSAAVLLTVGLVLAGTAASTRALKAGPEGPRPSERQAAGKTEAGPQPARADSPTGKQRGAQTTSSPKVRALLKERLTVLRDMVAILDEQHKAGRGSPGEIQKATLRVYKAELDLCVTDKERVAVHEKIVGALQELEKLVAALHERAAVSQTAVCEAKVNRLEAEIALERAREKAARPTK